MLVMVSRDQLNLLGAWIVLIENTHSIFADDERSEATLIEIFLIKPASGCAAHQSIDLVLSYICPPKVPICSQNDGNSPWNSHEHDTAFRIFLRYCVRATSYV